MKKIILNKRQITEVLGANFEYFNCNNKNFKEFNGNNEASTNDTLGNFNNIEPITTDEYVKSLAPRTFYGTRNLRANIFCNKEQNKSIVENNKNLEGKVYYLPDELYNFLVSLKNNAKSNVIGIKRLNNLLNNRNIKYKEMYTLKNYLNNVDKKSDEFKIIGGESLKNWVEKELNDSMELDRNIKQDKKNMGIENAFIKTHNKDGMGKSHSKKNGTTFFYE